MGNTMVVAIDNLSNAAVQNNYTVKQLFISNASLFASLAARDTNIARLLTVAPSSAASPRGEVGDDGKKTGNIGVARCKGGRERCVGYEKLLDGVVILDGGV